MKSGQHSSSPRSGTGRFALAIASTFGFFFSHQTLVVLTPYYVASSGFGDVATGSITGIFMLAATVTPLVMSGLLSRFDTRSLLLISVLLQAAPTFVYSLTAAPVPVAALSFVRGVGFGIASVGCAMVVSVLAAPEKRGAAFGWFGLSASSPGIFGPSLGLFLANNTGFGQTFAAMGLLTFVTLAPVLALGSIPPVPVGSSGSGMAWALRQRALLFPALTFTFAALVYGGLLTFVTPYLESEELGSPPIFFLILGFAIAASRYTGGTAVERLGAKLVFSASLGACAAGALLLALAPFALAPPVSALLFGLGFGTTATATHATLVSRVGRENFGTVNALFNVAFNGGISAGGALFGITAQATGYALTFLSGTLWIVFGAAIFAADRAAIKAGKDIGSPDQGYNEK